MNVYVRKQFQLGCHPHGGTPSRMEYAPLEIIFPPLESAILSLRCVPLETVHPLLVCSPLEVRREGEFLVASSKVGKNCSVFHIFQYLSCNCGVSGGWVAAALEFLVQGWPAAGISHGYL